MAFQVTRGGVTLLENFNRLFPLMVVLADGNGPLTGGIMPANTTIRRVRRSDTTSTDITSLCTMLEIDAVNFPGLYRVQIDLTTVSVPGPVEFLVSTTLGQTPPNSTAISGYVLPRSLIGD